MLLFSTYTTHVQNLPERNLDPGEESVGEVIVLRLPADCDAETFLKTMLSENDCWVDADKDEDDIESDVE